MDKISAWAARGLAGVDQVGAWIGLLGIRLLLAWEFGVAGLEKLQGENWFADIQGDFPFPFSVVPVEISWFLPPGPKSLAPPHW
jgi:putative oxidoreductase